MEKIFQRNKTLTPNSQTLRREMTPQESRLWYDYLKKLPVSVRRQHVIGNYIVDFYIPEKHLVIEIDGSQHKSADGIKEDALRDNELAKMGITVKRIANQSIDQYFNYVCEGLSKIINAPN